MRFRDDIDPATTWLISDTHFGHKNIIGYCHRPEDFEQLLLENINQSVRPGDTVLHLGDLCYKGNSWFKNVIAPKIAPDAARKLLIVGNHDRQRYSFYKQCGWKLARPFYMAFNAKYVQRFGYILEPWTGVESTISGYADKVVSFSHYQGAADSTDGKLPWERDSIDPRHTRIHGHIHNNGYFDGRNLTPPDWSLIPYLAQHVNLSCEMTKYKPVRLDHLLDAVSLGRLPAGTNTSDGDAPSGDEIGKENPHV